MSKILLFLTILCTCAFASVPKIEKPQKRGIVNDGWTGIPGPGYGLGHPWSVDNIPLKGLKLPAVNLHAGLHLPDALSAYGRGGIALTPGTLPVYITKHVVLEKTVPVPEPVIIEKPYHVPVPIEKIIHKPVPVPVPVPQAVPIPVERPVPIPVERPVPIPVKQPIPVPVHQPYPVAVKHPVPVPVPVPVPISVHPPPVPLPLSIPVHPPSIPLIPDGLAGAIYPQNYAPEHLHVHPPIALPLSHGIAPHSLGYGLGHLLAHGYSHDYDYAHTAHHVDHLAHEHDHKKRKTGKN